MTCNVACQFFCCSGVFVPLSRAYSEWPSDGKSFDGNPVSLKVLAGTLDCMELGNTCMHACVSSTNTQTCITGYMHWNWTHPKQQNYTRSQNNYKLKCTLSLISCIDQ